MNPRWPSICFSRGATRKNHFHLLVGLCSCLLVAGFVFSQGDESLRKRREDMVQTQIAAPRASGAERVQDSSVLDSMLKTPRDSFVPAELVPHAYDDRPLPIGYGQTISQPYIVAKITELLEPKREHQVTVFAFDQPQLRAVVLQSERESDLLLVTSHRICDGMSMLTIVREVLRGSTKTRI